MAMVVFIDVLYRYCVHKKEEHGVIGLLISFLFNHAPPAIHVIIERIKVWVEPNLLGRHRIFFHWLRCLSKAANNNGLKSLYIDICICIDSKALWKELRSYEVPFTADKNTEKCHYWWI
ncbi:hypothetical protein ACTXT7_015580 [Hymenolepis weldensis]